MVKHLCKIAFLSAMPLLAQVNAQAQTFVPPHAVEYPFNTRTSNAGDMSCFAFQNTMTTTAWGDVDVYLSGRGFGGSEVTVIFTAPGDPSNVYYRTNITGPLYNYDDGSYFQVGAIYNENTGNVQILVAYQYGGVNVDVFDITSSSTTPVVYNSTVNLVSWGYGNNEFQRRIRMDSDGGKLSKVALVWENPGFGIQTAVCQNGNWGNVLTLANTLGESGPDVAFNYMQGTPTVNYVHRDASGYQITESVIDFSVLMSSTGTVTPIVVDVNNLTNPITSSLVLDAQDIANGKGWAYTYSDNVGVYVRNFYDDPFSMATLNTITVNSGVLGNASIYGQYETYSPTICYTNAGREGIMVGWYITDGSYNGFIALEMTRDGLSLNSSSDYLELPDATTINPIFPSPYPNSATETGIAFSKCDGYMSPHRYLYAAYNNSDDGKLHHAFHDRNLSVFKGKVKGLDLSQGKVYPNPFSDVINTTVTLDAAGKVRLELIDIAGRTVSHYETDADKGTYPVKLQNLQDIIAGTYFLKTSVDGKQVTVKTVSKR